jgi:hypothetical protein
MTKPADPIALLDGPRTIVSRSDAILDELENALSEVKHVENSWRTDLAKNTSRWEDEFISQGPSEEGTRRLKALEEHGKGLEGLISKAEKLRAEIESRMTAVRESEREEKQRVEHAEVDALVESITSRWEILLGRFGPEARILLRDSAIAEQRVQSINENLPAGLKRIQLLEERRHGDGQLPVTTTRKFQAYVENPAAFPSQTGIFHKEKFHATRRGDGRFDVILPGNAHNGGEVVVASLCEVTVTRTETPAKLRYESLAGSLSIPQFNSTLKPWFRSGSYTARDVLRALADLEEPTKPPRPRVEERISWVRISGFEPVPAQAAAE